MVMMAEWLAHYGIIEGIGKANFSLVNTMASRSIYPSLPLSFIRILCGPVIFLLIMMHLRFIPITERIIIDINYLKTAKLFMFSSTSARISLVEKQWISLLYG